MQVMTLIGSGAEALARTIEGAERLEVLAPGHAVDLYFSGAPPHAAGGIDFVVQAAEGRRKKLLLADMESTIIENEMLDELADFLGLKDEVAEITRKAMNDEIDFVAALEARVALLRGLDEAVLGKAAERIRIMPGAAELVATMRANGACCALVSGGFRCFTAPVRERLGFDHETANELVVESGKLAGTVRPPVVTRETKLATLQGLAQELSLPLSATLAVGDGANDLPMIEAAGLGVAYRAKPTVAARARVRIEHNDLTALLYAQGYRADEIVRP